MSKKLEIPVGVAFEKRLAELVWENCPELARSTAAGKMALALDVDADHIGDVVVASLLSIAEEKLLPSIAKKVNELADEIVAKFQDDAKTLLKNTADLLDKALAKQITDKLDTAVERAVVRVADNSMERLCRDKVQEYYGGHFPRIVAERLNSILEANLKSRLSYDGPAAAINKAQREVAVMKFDALKDESELSGGQD
jgi:phosphoribosyl-ATP pyrophosphohydrolase